MWNKKRACRARAPERPKFGNENSVFLYKTYSVRYDINLILWTTLYRKNGMIAGVILLWRIHVTSLTKTMSTCFPIEIIFYLKAIQSHFKGLFEKQNFIRVDRYINL